MGCFVTRLIDVVVCVFVCSRLVYGLCVYRLFYDVSVFLLLLYVLLCVSLVSQIKNVYDIHYM